MKSKEYFKMPSAQKQPMTDRSIGIRLTTPWIEAMELNMMLC